MKPRFNYAKMRATFYAWHSGQNSPLYAAASSGLVADIGALQREIRADAESMWTDQSNFTGGNCVGKYNGPSYMKRKQYAEWQYLRRVADALESILSEPFVHSFDGRTYRALPWAKRE